MKAILTFLSLLGTVAVCLAQSTDPVKPKQEIGFNTNFLLYGLLDSEGSPFDLMYKKQRSETTAMRWGLSFYISKSFSPSSYQSNYSTDDNYSVSISFGKEFQKHFAARWIFYYGFDLLPEYGRSSSENISNQITTNTYQNYRYGVSLQPFLGLRFVINQRLYISTESPLQLSYRFNKANWFYFNGIDATRFTKKEPTFTMSILPASGINAFYRF